ncbi:Ankyrin-1 [Nymphon striatum]|nr:Ankyrin-1 [Nymphon striatum]
MVYRLRYGWMLALLVRIAGATLTYLKLQPKLRLCKALPGIHVFTGCDYTSFCIRKGKKRPLKIAEENYSFLDAFAALATGEVDRAACEALEEYTSKLYGAKQTLPLNKHRYQCSQKYGSLFGTLLKPECHELFFLKLYICGKQVVTRLVLGARAAANEKSYIPAWSGFNCLVSTTKVPVAVIRYLPFINANPSDYSTIYTTLLKLVSIAKALGQGRILVTADLAIYSKAQQILWTRPDAIADMITMRLGGMMAFIASIDKLFGDGGLYNLLTESNVYATSTVTQMFLGKQYSRGMRGIRLVHEGMYQQFLRSAEQFANEHRLPWFSEDIIRFVNELEDSFRLKDRHACTAICQEAESKISSNVIETIEAFRKAGREQSTTFCYWDTFLEMGDILLRLTRADREANLSMHLDAVMKAIPFFFLAGRVNCARTVYVAEMKELDTKDPNMFNHMKSGGFVVKRAEDKMFNCVPTDQALEPTINREAKTQGGIIGFTSRKGALLRWLLTRHVTGEYSEAFKDICVNHGFSLFYDELGNARMQQDRKDATNIKEFIQSRCQNPFDLDNIPSTLVNITTGQVATPEVEKSLIGATEKCQKATDELFAERIDKRSSGSFWDPLPRCPVVTFSSKKKALSYDKDRKLIIDTEILFRRLLSVSKNCEVDMRSVLSFELAAVPPSLFHDDGSMRKTTKAELTKKLEESCTNCMLLLAVIQLVQCSELENAKHTKRCRRISVISEICSSFMKLTPMCALNRQDNLFESKMNAELLINQLLKDDTFRFQFCVTVRCIHIEAQRDHVEVVRALLMKGENVDTKTNDGSTLIHIASENGHPETAMVFLRKGVPLHMPNKAGARCIHIAAQRGHVEVVRALLMKGENVDTKTNDNHTALHIAVKHCKPLVVELLLGYGAQVHIKAGETSETPLHIAARVQNGEKCAEMLLKSGTDVNSAQLEGLTPLHMAINNCRYEVVRELLDLMESRNDREASEKLNGMSSLMMACEKGHLETVTLLLQHHARVDVFDENGRMALHLAAENGHWAVIDVLLAHKAFVNAKSKSGVTPLHLAAMKGYSSLVMLLVEKFHAVIDALTIKKRTPLHCAAETGQLEVCKMLLDMKADTNATDVVISLISIAL